MTTTTYDDVDNDNNGKKLQESKPIVGGVDPGGLLCVRALPAPLFPSPFVVPRLQHGKFEVSRVGTGPGGRLRETSRGQRRPADITPETQRERERDGKSWRISWPGWPREEERRGLPGQDYRTPPWRSGTRGRRSCARSSPGQRVFPLNDRDFPALTNAARVSTGNASFGGRMLLARDGTRS